MRGKSGLVLWVEASGLCRGWCCEWCRGLWRLCAGLGWLGDESKKRIKNKKYFNEMIKKIEVLILNELKSDMLNAINLVF